MPKESASRTKNRQSGQIIHTFPSFDDLRDQINSIPPMNPNHDFNQRTMHLYAPPTMDLNQYKTQHAFMFNRKLDWIKGRILSRMQHGVRLTTHLELGELFHEDYHVLFEISGNVKVLRRKVKLDEVYVACPILINHLVRTEHPDHPLFLRKDLEHRVWFGGLNKYCIKKDSFWIDQIDFKYFPSLNTCSITFMIGRNQTFIDSDTNAEVE